MPRVDDRRVICGIVHVLKSGRRWIDAPSDYGPRKTLYNRYMCGRQGYWVDLFHALASAGGPPAQMLIDSSALKANRSTSGEKGGTEPSQSAIRAAAARPRYTLTDLDCRPIAILLTGGQVADCTACAALLKQMPAARILHGDKGYDSNTIRRQVEENGTMPTIPPRVRLCPLAQSFEQRLKVVQIDRRESAGAGPLR